ncbi:MAG: hypothetical protein ACR2FU_22760 [Streptosporangiaceae bacterium]
MPGRETGRDDDVAAVGGVLRVRSPGEQGGPGGDAGSAGRRGLWRSG